MKKLALIGIALAVGVLAVPAVSPGQTAPAKSPYCDMKGKGPSWRDYYHCNATQQSGPAARQQSAARQ
jgi:hypothetical protein